MLPTLGRKRISSWYTAGERSARVAVVLNAHARRVDERVVRRVRDLVGSSLYVSRSLDQARFIARHIVNQDYDAVLCGGGDGTFTRCVSDIVALRPQRLPAFGVLRLGTGNALADVLGAGKGRDAFEADLACARDTRARFSLPLLAVDGKVAPFAGVGLDAMILEDYTGVKSRLANTPLSALGQGHAGYGLAIASRSVWRLLLERPVKVTVRNDGAPAHLLTGAGMPVGAPIARGAIIYSGPATLAGVSTVPCYGFGARIYPQAAALRDRFQLRLANVSASALVARLPEVLSGDFAHERLWDYACTAVTIDVEAPVATQVGGDLVGRRQRVAARLTRVTGIVGPSGVEDATASDAWFSATSERARA